MTEKKPLAKVLPWQVRISLSFLSSFTDFSCRSNGTVNRRLIRLFDITAKVPAKSGEGVDVSDVTVDSSRKLWFRIYIPTDITSDSNLPVFVFFHGGAFTFLSADTISYDSVCRRFARKIPAIVVSVNYRLTPEYRFPAQYNDGFDTLKFLDHKSVDSSLLKHADLSRCFLGGDSAGGNLAHHVAVRFADSKKEFCKLNVIGLISIQPFFGGEERTESETRLKGAPLVSVERTDWHWKVFLPQGENRDHEGVNVFGPKSRDISGLENFPSSLVFVGGWDPLQDWQKRYYEGLKKNGKRVRLIEYPNAIHAFYLFPLPESLLLLNEVKEFVNSNGCVEE